jgi:Fe-S-cluster containining protein
MQCPFVTKDGCGCYEFRPFTCRIFGTVEDMRCPMGARPEKLLTIKEASELAKPYASLFKEE